MKNKEMMLVSAIVPIYNVEKYLEKCVDSLLSQTYPNLEIILVDDGSTDSSGKIADEYARRYNTIKVLHKRNAGLSSARNVGIENANGHWLVFVDSDDYVSDEYVSKLLELAIVNNADISTCSFEAFSDDGSKLKISPVWPNKVLSGVDAMDDMMKNLRPAYACLSIYSASLFKDNKIEFPDGQEFEDLATKVRLLYHAKRVAFTDEKLYHYLIRNGSITGGKMSKIRADDYLKALKDIKDFVSNLDFEDRIEHFNYFEFNNLMNLMGYFAREQDVSFEEKKYWCKIHKMACGAYWKAKFPTIKSRIFKGCLLILSINMNIYSIIYRKVRK